jgi:hypothetical protein
MLNPPQEGWAICDRNGWWGDTCQGHACKHMRGGGPTSVWLEFLNFQYLKRERCNKLLCLKWIYLIMTNVQKKPNLAHRWRYIYRGVIGMMTGPGRFVWDCIYLPFVLLLFISKRLIRSSSLPRSVQQNFWAIVQKHKGEGVRRKIHYTI